MIQSVVIQNKISQNDAFTGKKKKDFFFLFFSTGMQVTPCQDEVTVTNKGAILNVE